MKIALIGYGKMCQIIEEIAVRNGHTITTHFSHCTGTLVDRPQDLSTADLALDFSQPSAVMDNLNICLAQKKPLVIGTTGWEDNLTAAKSLVQQSRGSCFYSPNFSIGVYLFQQIMTHAASLIQPFNEYDVSGVESHHKQKLDHPSGTAKALTQTILKHMPRIKSLEFSSIRCGSIPGTHSVIFDGPSDTMTFTHQARNRQSFAQGAILAAEWLFPRKGFFTMDDMMQDYFSTKMR